MESSYRIIKGDYIETSTDDEYIIDTDIEDILIEIEEEEEEMLLEEEEEEALEPDIDDQRREEIIRELDEYKKKVHTEIEFERKSILENALIEAEKEAIEIRKTARKDGYREGFIKAIDDAKDKAKKIKKDSLDILDDVKEYRDSYLRENEEKIYDLARAMAENIIHYSIDANDETIINIIKPTLEEYLREEDITITTTEKGKRLLEKHKDSLCKICPNTRFIFLVDKSIEENGFVIENKESIVDLAISTQLENMIRAISDING